MKLEIFAVKDTATNVFDKPFFLLTKAAAVRAFADEANNKDSQLHLHPHDYILYHIGTLDQDSGIVDQSNGIQDLGSAATYLNPDNVIELEKKQ